MNTQNQQKPVQATSTDKNDASKTVSPSVTTETSKDKSADNTTTENKSSPSEVKSGSDKKSAA